jgi:hypothetical protein
MYVKKLRLVLSTNFSVIRFKRQSSVLTFDF